MPPPALLVVVETGLFVLGIAVAEVTERKGVGGWLRSAPVFFNQVEAERKKVVWPARRETVMTAVMVAVLTIVLGIFFFGVDKLFASIVRYLLSLA